MSGSVDLSEMLRSLSVSRRVGRFTICTVDETVSLDSGVEAIIREAEGVTVVTTVEAAQRNGWAIDFEAAWLTLDVHSSLKAVGLTAAVSTALTRVGISCNVIAGFYHDHLLVPLDRAAQAIECLVALRDQAP